MSTRTEQSPAPAPGPARARRCSIVGNVDTVLPSIEPDGTARLVLCVATHHALGSADLRFDFAQEFEWLTATVRGAHALELRRLLSKGSPVLIEGELRRDPPHSMRAHRVHLISLLTRAACC